MPKDHRCPEGNCKTCKRVDTNRKPFVRDCWYDVPYVWLEVTLRLISLMAILVLLCVIIHLTVGQLSTLKPFNSFLEHSHLITDASELGILGKPTKEEGLYSPQDEKDDIDLKGMQSSRARNTTKLWDLPMEIYKGTDDENAYFITFRELCDEKSLTEGPKVEELSNKDHSQNQAIPISLQSFYGRNYQSDPHSSIERIMGNAKMSSSESKPVIGGSVDSQNADMKLAVGNSDMRKTNPEFKERLSHSKLTKIDEAAKESSIPVDTSKLQLSNNDMPNFEHFVRMRENGDNGKISQNSHGTSMKNNQQNVLRSETKEAKNREEQSMNEVSNEGQYSSKPIPKLKLVLNEHPQSILEMKIDMNNVKTNELTPMNGGDGRLRNPGKLDDGEPDGISIEEEDMEAENADEAMKYLKDKITRKIQKKEDEILERLENRPRPKGVMEVESDAVNFGNFSYKTLLARRPRAVDTIDRSITYTEHERTMKQEVEVTYKRAQDIAKAILKTSEAIANSLDLCRKPMSTNFISDEPLTEAEDVIGQIVSQLKESLELTMGCRTCVKPHKDLMLFLRWLIFDDVSVKLCPSKPKAADLRKNYLLFNHDNMFLGRVCSPGEYPKAPFSCNATNEVMEKEMDVGKQAESKNVQRKGVAKKRLRMHNND